jgi:deoxyribose-phosphate aldolase
MRECGYIAGAMDELHVYDAFEKECTYSRCVPVAEGNLDPFPVTNADYKRFLEASGYTPADPRNFLLHWVGGEIPVGLESHPVVYVCLEDARAYAAWAGKRLPTEEEWQLAAQGADGRIWPWGGDALDPARCNHASAGTTPVDAYPQGRTPEGLWDLCGNVWEMTESERSDGHTRYQILKGGSWFHVTNSHWLFDTGPPARLGSKTHSSLSRLGPLRHDRFPLLPTQNLKSILHPPSFKIQNPKIPNLSMNLAKYIQYTNVNPEMTRDDAIAHCEAVLKYGFDAAMIAPCWMKLGIEILKGSDSHVATAFSFPSGNDSTEMKVACVREILKAGVKDFDFTAQTSYLLSGMEKEYFEDLKAIADVAKAEGAQTKVIIEFGLLNQEQRRRGAELAVEAGIDYLKQSSGFVKGIPATPEDVAFLKAIAGDRAKVKGSGKINSREKALKLIAAGASLLGTSSAIAIVNEQTDETATY